MFNHLNFCYAKLRVLAVCFHLFILHVQHCYFDAMTVAIYTVSPNKYSSYK